MAGRSGFVPEQDEGPHLKATDEAAAVDAAVDERAVSRVRAQSPLYSKLRQASGSANLLVGVIALVGLIGWVSDLPQLTSLGTASPPILPTSVVALGLMAIALRALRAVGGAWRQWTIGVAAFGVIVVALGALAVDLSVLGWHDFPLAAIGLLYEPVPTSAGSASCYLMVGIALLLVLSDGRRRWELAQFIAIAVAGVVMVSLVGLSFRLVRLDVAVPSLGMALPVAIALLAVSFCLLATRPSPHLRQLLERDSPGGLIARRLVPMAIGLPLLAVWIQAAGLRVGWFDSTESESVLTVATIVACVALILWMSNHLDMMNLTRAQAEERALTQRQWLDVTLANIGDAVVTVDDRIRVNFLNPAAEALVEVRSASAVGRYARDLLELVDVPSGKRLSCPLEPVFAFAHPIELEGEPAIRRHDGRLQPVEVTATPIKGAGGQVVGSVLVLRDVSVKRAREHAEREAIRALDRQVAERTRELDSTMTALREKTALLRTIAASTPELIVAKSRDGRIMMINLAAMQSLGLGEEAIGRTEEELFGSTDDIRCVADSDRRVVDTGQPSVVEENRILHKGARTYLVTKSPLRNVQGQVFGLVAVAKDITERKRAQQDLERLLVAEHRLRGDAEQANRAKDEFLAIVSHELRSPLNALKGWSQVLSGTRQPEPALVARAAEAIKRNIDHQTRLIDDLLDTSRIISGKLELSVCRVNLVDVVNAVLDLWKRAARDKLIELRFDCDDGEVYVEGDFDRLQQVLSNLLSNSVKFTPEKGRVQVGLLKTERSVELSVSDNGVGIEADFLPHVFDRFSQADTSMTRRHVGLGIGLALVRSLVELHRGSVEATSAGEGQGAKFSVRLPPARQPVMKDNGKPDTGCAAAPRLEGVTALVVDDEADSREVMRLMLERAGAQVLSFDSGEALFSQWNAILPLPAPALMLLDIAMPGASGFEVLGRIRLDARTAELPVIAVTAYPQIDGDRFVAAGFDGKVGKPVDEQALIELIAAVVGRSGQLAS
jgi:PAS domain S-box-containing protein